MDTAAQSVPIRAPCAAAHIRPQRDGRAPAPKQPATAVFLFVSRVMGRAARNLPKGERRKAVTLAQRTIELLIGRLITDEEFRADFLSHPEKTLVALCDHGWELSRTEIAALVATEPALWARTADALDPRLQKASFRNGVKVP
jgi:hypothetical protein